MPIGNITRTFRTLNLPRPIGNETRPTGSKAMPIGKGTRTFSSKTMPIGNGTRTFGNKTNAYR